MIQEIRKPIESFFQQYSQVLDDVMSSQNPMLNNISDHLRQSRGKQIRPLLVILSAALCGNVNKNTILSAVALELLHTASLIHDDVVDDAMERRSQPSVKALWNNKVSILAGDYYLSKVMQVIAQVPHFEIIKAIGGLGATLSEGEIEQLSFSKDFSANKESYFQIIRKKTASLFATCTFSGALTAQTSAMNIEKLRLFGENLGIAFQIRDDIFDYYENNDLGKPIGNDLIEGKLTLPLIYALAQDCEKARIYREFLSSGVALTPEKVSEIYEFAKEIGGITYAEQQMEVFRADALAQITDFPDSNVKNSLIKLLDYCIKRNF